MPLNAAILVYPGVEELDFIAPWEVLNAAKKLGGDLEVHLVTVEKLPIKAVHGMAFFAEALNPSTVFDLFIIPGGAWLAGGSTGIRAASEDRRLVDYIISCVAEGTVIATVCTGVFLLARAGLLNGRAATTHHGAHADLKGFGVDVKTHRVVDDGSIISAGGVTSGLDLGLWLVERFLGQPLSQKVEDYLEYRRTGEVFRVSESV